MAIRAITRSLVLASVCLALSASLACAQGAKAKPRVLIFAGAQIRDVQFLRTVLARAALEKRAELTVLLQTGDKVEPVEGEKPMLKEFPDRLGADLPGKKGLGLSNYDAIIAFDPDWTKLTEKQLKNLNEWVGEHGGGLMFVAGPINTHQLSRPGGNNFKALLPLVPVELKDGRLHGIGVARHDALELTDIRLKKIDATRPFALNFCPTAKDFDFLKLDEKEDGPTGGWSRFFGERIQKEKHLQPTRGNYSCHPVTKVRPFAVVLATLDSFGSQPYLVTMPYGKGTTMYLGSAETWRLRQFSADYHQRFWTKLTAYLAEKVDHHKEKNL